MPKGDLYETLGVPPNADAAEIKRAYRKRRSSAHPDRHGDKTEFHAVTVAFEILSDPARRRRYDETGDDTQSAQDPRQKAMGDVAQLLMQILSALDPDTTDYCDAMRSSIVNAQQQRRAKIAELAEAISRRNKALKRFKRKKKGGLDLMAEILKGNVRELQRGISSLEAEIEHGAAMIAIVAEYEYSFDKGMRPPGFPAGYGSPGMHFIRR